MTTKDYVLTTIPQSLYWHRKSQEWNHLYFRFDILDNQYCPVRRWLSGRSSATKWKAWVRISPGAPYHVESTVLVKSSSLNDTSRFRWPRVVCPMRLQNFMNFRILGKDFRIVIDPHCYRASVPAWWLRWACEGGEAYPSSVRGKLSVAFSQ